MRKSILTSTVSFLMAFSLAVTLTVSMDAQAEGSQNSKTKKVKFIFDKIQVEMVITKIKSGTSKKSYSLSEIDGARVDHGTLNQLKIKTPQFSEEKALDMPAELINNFEGQKTVESDISALKLEAKPQETKLGKNVLYSWTTPTMGSEIFYYLQNPKDSKMALKIGPLAGLVAQDFNFNWKKARWIKLK